MSFPSIAQIIATRGKPLSELTSEEKIRCLAEAWKKDCPLAYARLKGLYQNPVLLTENRTEVSSYDMHGNPALHLEMLRTFASSAIREGVLPHVFPNMKIDFINCCADVGSFYEDPLTITDLVTLQIQFQNGDHANADC